MADKNVVVYIWSRKLGSTARVSKDRIHPVDRHVGQRVRLARVSKKMSQTALGDASGITFQQIQKYEKGTNRISASRLFEFAAVLDVEISYFFDGASGRPGQRGADASHDDFNFDRVDVAILRSLYAIDDSKLKRSLLKLIESVRPGSR